MRYSDVLLMLAAAKTMQNKVSEAMPLVKRIRARALLADILMAGWTKDQMMTEIMNQRNIEFASEGLHFFDLRRWGTLEAVIKASPASRWALFNAKFAYYPIPQSELNNNPSMTQNAPW